MIVAGIVESAGALVAFDVAGAGRAESGGAWVAFDVTGSGGAWVAFDVAGVEPEGAMLVADMICGTVA